MKALVVGGLLVGLLGGLAACGGGDTERVIVAAGTTLVDSGFVDDLASAFEQTHPGTEISVIGEATAQVLELGRSGGAQVLLVHAPLLEEQFVDSGEAKSRQTVVESRFLLVGPPDRVGVLRGLDFVEAFGVIARSEGPFVSRADGSGTDIAEGDLWRAAAYDPGDDDWYVETGQGMGLTLQVADQRGAFTLTEEGAYVAASGTLGLEVADLSDVLVNPYSVIVVEDASRSAVEFGAWLTSPEGAATIERVNDQLFGRNVYQP